MKFAYRKFLLFCVLLCTMCTLHAQKRYRNIPRTRINTEVKTKPIENQFIQSQDTSTLIIKATQIHEKPFIVAETHEHTSLPTNDVVQNMEVQTKASTYHQPIPSEKKPAKRSTHLKSHHPLKTTMDSDELDTMAWISLAACITFVGGVLINFFLGGFSTIVIVFIILSAVFALATVIFFILSNTIGE